VTLWSRPKSSPFCDDHVAVDWARTHRYDRPNSDFYEYYRLYSNEDETEQPPCAPLHWGQSRLERVMQPLRSVLEPWIDVRTTRDKIRGRLAARAQDLVD
jgi:hypothetical protein